MDGDTLCIRKLSDDARAIFDVDSNAAIVNSSTDVAQAESAIGD